MRARLRTDRAIVRMLLAALAVVIATGCSRPGENWHAKNVTGLVPDLELAMTDDAGRPVRAADYRGSTVLLFFGYTHCPDVCPMTLARLTQAARATRDNGKSIRVLFVTVDPARDAQAELHDYVRSFGPEVVGLRGTNQALDELARRYRVSFSLGEPDAHGNYEVNHSSGVFVFDKYGKARLLIRPNDPAPAITADLDRLAAG